VDREKNSASEGEKVHQGQEKANSSSQAKPLESAPRAADAVNQKGQGEKGTAAARKHRVEKERKSAEKDPGSSRIPERG